MVYVGQNAFMHGRNGMPDETLRDQFHRYTEKASYRDGLIESQVKENTERSKDNQKRINDLVGSMWFKLLTTGITVVLAILAVMKFGAEFLR